MTNQQFIEMAEEEKGLYNLYMYGVRPHEIDDLELRALWKEFCFEADKIQQISERIGVFFELQ